MAGIKIKSILFEGHEIKDASLEGLLSNTILWGEKNYNRHEGYNRYVEQRNGKTFTIFTKKNDA